MDKPLNMLVEEGKEKIVQAVNSCKLPPFLLEPILKDIYVEIKTLKEKELLSSKQQYEKSLKGDKTNGK